jgi:hypothetical protein
VRQTEAYTHEKKSYKIQGSNGVGQMDNKPTLSLDRPDQGTAVISLAGNWQKKMDLPDAHE